MDSGPESSWSNPNANPSIKAIADAVRRQYPHIFNPIGRATYVGQGSDPTLITIAPNGSCATGTSADIATIIGFDTTQGEDSFGLKILGSPNEPGANDLFTQSQSRGSTANLGFRSKDGKPRKLPYISAGKLFTIGASLSDYGNDPIPDTKNPGKALAAPGSTDSIVTGYTETILRDTYLRPRLVPDGTTTGMSPCPPPLDPPATVQTVNNSSTLGDLLQRQYAIAYTTGSGDSELGPHSQWGRGFLQTSVTLPAVPSGAAWSAVTGQKVYRRTEGSDVWKLLQTFADLLTHTITDTTADASLGTTYTPVDTKITASGGGGGGGSGGPGAAVYGISVEFDDVGSTSAIPVPWDTILTGDDVYLDPANTDGLTIPANGGGDYWAKPHLWIDTGSVGSHDWAVEYHLTIEHWRAGTMLISTETQDVIGGSSTAYENGVWIGDFTVTNGVAVCGTQPGDVIKTGIALFGSSDDGAPFFLDVSRDNGHTFVSIVPSGSGSPAAGSNSGVSNKTANYTITGSDNGKIILASAASLTFTLPDPTTVPAGFQVTVKNNNETTTGVKTNTAGVDIDGVDCSSTAYTTGLTGSYSAVTFTVYAGNWITT